MNFMKELYIFLLGMSPLLEVRAAIPMGIVFGFSPLKSYILGVGGNILVIFLLFSFLPYFINLLSTRFSFFKKYFLNKKENYSPKIERYGIHYLFFFTFLPFPFTGGWTATLIALLFNLPFKKSFLVISMGVLGAGILVLFLTILGISVKKYFGLQFLIGIILTFLIVWMTYKLKNDEQ